MFKKILILLVIIAIEQKADALAVTYSFSPNTLIASSQINQNFSDVETVVNALTATNLSADCVTAEKINSDVVRAGYGLVQHTDGSLYVDVSDTNPGLEITDGGLRAKVYGLLSRTANGVEWGRAGDMLLTSNSTVPDGFTNVSSTYGNKFIRVSASGLATGGADSHTHTGGTYAAQTQVTAQVYVSGSSVVCAGGTTGLTGSSSSADNIPAYVSMYMYQKS